MKPVVRYGIAGGIAAASIGLVYLAFRKPAAEAKSTDATGPVAGSACTDAEVQAHGLDPHGMYKHDANGFCVPDQQDS